MHVRVMFSVDRHWQSKKQHLRRLAQRLCGCEVGLAAHLGTCEVVFDFPTSREAESFVEAVREEAPGTGILSQTAEHCLLTSGTAARAEAVGERPF